MIFFSFWLCYYKEKGN